VLSLTQLHDLPTPFYRVAAKALIFDDQNCLLIVFNQYGEAEIPGGGWEHDESFEECLQRELQEELGVKLKSISPILFTVRDKTLHGWHALRLVARCKLATNTFMVGDDMSSYKYVAKEEFLKLKTADQADERFKDYVDEIWSTDV
jgi:ADP-ribose pyrophosphatase YjhB (NUDIX family)